MLWLEKFCIKLTFLTTLGQICAFCSLVVAWVFYPLFTQLSIGKKFLTSFNLVAAIKELQLGFNQNCGGEVSPVWEGGETEFSGKSLISLPK